MRRLVSQAVNTKGSRLFSSTLCLHSLGAACFISFVLMEGSFVTCLQKKPYQDQAEKDKVGGLDSRASIAALLVKCLAC